ncbi:MAG: crossover junction endodeoxyribonuclease RuvC [Chloroflexi bacterium]|nr:crossover junction endodeoxyribonuclease RuvC [Chloroflexota bacterium]MDA1228176.1 crossover junction endodeoxyribonuclease RuvC [Chloroflexota bacterium]
MRVLGIDPGTFNMGLGIVDTDGPDIQLAHVDVLKAKKNLPIAERLSLLYAGVLQCIDEWKPTETAIEQPFVARNVRSAMAVGQAQAIAMLAAANRGMNASTYSPREVKQAVTDYGGSSKEQVQEMVRVLLGLQDAPTSSDATDALAVAICHVNASRVQALSFRD